MPYVLRNKKDVKTCEAFEAHGGNGTILVNQILGDLKGSEFPGFPEDFDTPVNFVHVITLPKGTSIGNHPHINNEEFYFVIKGRGKMIVDGKELIMEEGSICLIKRESEHSFENPFDEDLTALVMEVEMS
ncbi:cupin domain-containing protein [Clostridium sp. DL1XJH146]